MQLHHRIAIKNQNLETLPALLRHSHSVSDLNLLFCLLPFSLSSIHCKEHTGKFSFTVSLVCGLWKEYSS